MAGPLVDESDGGQDHDDDLDEDDKPEVLPLPGAVKHKCTDVRCLVFFIIMFFLYAALGGSFLSRCNYKRAFWPLDYNGSVCGVDIPSKPYFAFCRTKKGDAMYKMAQHALWEHGGYGNASQWISASQYSRLGGGRSSANNAAGEENQQAMNILEEKNSTLQVEAEKAAAKMIRTEFEGAKSNTAADALDRMAENTERRHSEIMKDGEGDAGSSDADRNITIAAWYLFDKYADKLGYFMDLKHPLCVKECPAEGKPISSGSNLFDSCEGYATFEVGKFCVPKNFKSTAIILLRSIEKQLFGARKVWWIVIIAAAFFAAVSCFLYIFFLSQCAGFILRGVEIAVIVLPLVLGLICIASESVFFRSKHIGYILLFMSGAFLLAYCACLRRGTDVAVACMESAVQCMVAAPWLMLQPFFTVPFKVTLALMTLGIEFSVWGCADITFSLESITLREYNFSTLDWVLSGLILAFMAWGLAFLTGMIQLVVSYTAQLWYFTPYVDGTKTRLPRFACCKAIWFCIRYHLGSVAYGGFMTSIASFLFAPVGCLRACTTANECITCMACCCEMVVSCLKGVLKLFLAKNSFMIVALTSESYDDASTRAMSIILSQTNEAMTLMGVTCIFSVGGYITALAGAILGMDMLLCLPAFTSEESDYFVDEEGGGLGILILVLIVAIVVGHDFMLIFDIVGDSLFFCYTVDLSRQKDRVASLLKDEEADEPQSSFKVVNFFPCGGRSHKDTATSKEMQALFQERSRYAPPVLESLLETRLTGNY